MSDVWELHAPEVAEKRDLLFVALSNMGNSFRKKYLLLYSCDAVQLRRKCT